MNDNHLGNLYACNTAIDAAAYIRSLDRRAARNSMAEVRRLNPKFAAAIDGVLLATPDPEADGADPPVPMSRDAAMALAEQVADADRAWALAFVEAGLDPDNAEKAAARDAAADRANALSQELQALFG